MSRYRIRAGSYLVTKEFRYIMTLRIKPLFALPYKANTVISLLKL